MTLSALGIFSAAGARPAVIPFPTGITGLVARYDAQDLSSISLSGSKVTQWNDLSGNGRHASQGTDTNRPSSGTRTINGKNALDFDGNDTLINDSIAASFSGNDKPFTFFYVTEVDSGSLTALSISWSGSGVPYFWTYAGTQYWRDDSNIESFSTFDDNSTGQKYFTLRSSGLNFTAWKNKTQTVAGYSYNRGNITLDRAAIGSYRPAIDSFYNGSIGEVIYYNRELTTDEVAQVQNYLSARWGI